MDFNGYPLWVENVNFTLPMHDDLHDRDIIFKIPTENRPPFEPFIVSLSADQIAGLWHILESTIFLEQDGCPGWLLAKKLEIPDSHLSSRVTKPLQKLGLIDYKSRPTTKPRSSHPNKRENAWYIKRFSMENVFNILYSIFEKYNFNDLCWSETVSPLKFGSELDTDSQSKEDAKSKQKEKIHPNTKLLILAYLQKKIEDYKNSAEFFTDQGIKPPIGVSPKIDSEKSN